MVVMSKTKKPKDVAHDETPSNIVDHPFEPRGEWYTLCKHCGLAESAHLHTTLRFRYYAEDAPEDD